jgi:hypothetical protein
MARPLVLLELSESADTVGGPLDEKTAAAIAKGLAAANALQPVYSHVMKGHTLIVPRGSLPRTVKGTVQRSKAESIYAADLAAVKAGRDPNVPTLLSGSDAEDEGGADSLALSSSPKTGPTDPLEHLTGLRTIGCFWILMVHFASTTDTDVTGLFDKLIDRGHIAICMFIVASGFGLQWSHGTFSWAPALAASDTCCGKFCECAKYVGVWYVTRFHRIIIVASVAMTFGYVVETDMFNETGLPGLGWSLLFYFKMWDVQRKEDIWTFVNEPLWYIGALSWSWFLFPFAAPLFRYLKGTPWPFSIIKIPAWPVMALVPLLALLAYMPVLILLGETSTVDGVRFSGGIGYYRNILEYTPQAWMPDFFCGVASATVAKVLKPSLSKYLERPASAGFVQKYLAPFSMSMAVDGMACLVIFFTLRVVGEDGADNQSGLAVIVYHSATFPISMWYLLSVASGGYGLSTMLFRSAPLVSLGRYALYVYVFQEPFVYIMNTIFTGATTTSAHLDGDLFLWYVMCLWFFSAIYAEYIETPFVDLCYKLPGFYGAIMGKDKAA